MFCNKRVWWASLLILLSFVLPAPGHSVEIDPYMYKTLTGVVYFEWQRSDTDQDGIEGETSQFQQVYSLDFRASLLSRSLMVYDTGISFSDTNFNSDTSNYTTKDLRYYLRTTLLPLSPIPLTLYGDRTEQEIDGTSERVETKTTLGLNWLLNLRRIPTTIINIERNTTEGTFVDLTDTYFNLNMRESYGPTDNTLNYTYKTMTNGRQALSDTSEHTVDARNATRLSSSTSFNLGMTADKITRENSTDSSLLALSFNLTSRPSIDFNQSHNYTFYTNETGDDKAEGQNYSGDLGYRFSERLNSTLSLNVDSSETFTDTSQFRSDSLQTGGSLDYRATDHLTLSEQFTFSRYETNAVQPGFESTDRRTLQVLSRATYQDIYRWAFLYASYAIGYTEDSALDRNGGAGITQNATLSLSNIDFNPIFGLNTSASYYYTEGISGDIWERRTDYNAGLFNKALRRYVNFNANYRRHSSSAWIAKLAERSEIYGLDINTSYIRNTKLGANAENAKRFNEIAGSSETTTFNAYASHNRTFLGGFANLGFQFNQQEGRSTSTDQRHTTFIYNAGYTRRITQNTFWEFDAMTSRTKATERVEKFKNLTEVKNSLIWLLRAWFLSAEHKYKLTEDDNRKLTENTIILRATRSFVRTF